VFLVIIIFIFTISLTCYLTICSRILSDILLGIHPDILYNMLCEFYSNILSGILSDILSSTVSGIYVDILFDFPYLPYLFWKFKEFSRPL